MEIVYDKGVYLPEIKLWLDPHGAKKDEAGFVSHAHGDHAGWHRTTFCSPPTARFMRLRQTPPTDIELKTPAFLKPFKFNGAQLTLLPAGHIAGSAQLLVEHKDERLIYSGDFKLRPDPACEAIVIEEAQQLVMETTFGRPEYLFPPASKTIERIYGFCEKTWKERRHPVLLAYSLGKAQELMMSLKPWGVEFVLPPSIAQMADAYKALGYALPPYHTPGNTALEGKILLWPPQGRSQPWYQGVADRCRTAYLSGWAMDPGAKFRLKADECFPLSDHADFSELLAYVWQVHPKQICTHHGFAADFASHLRLTGHDARALGEVEQLELI